MLTINQNGNDGRIECALLGDAQRVPRVVISVRQDDVGRLKIKDQRSNYIDQR